MRRTERSGGSESCRSGSSQSCSEREISESNHTACCRSAQPDLEKSSDEGNTNALAKGQECTAKREAETTVVHADKRGLRSKDLRTMSDSHGLIKIDKRRWEPLQKNWQERMDRTKSAFFIDPR